MDTDEAVRLTQERLIHEGSELGELIDSFRDKVSPALVDDPTWQRVVNCAHGLPITLAANPFGFEFPLHEPEAIADLGVSMTSDMPSASYFRDLAEEDPNHQTANSLVRLFHQMDADDASLREIVGRKVMLEYDIGSSRSPTIGEPGLFLRPGERMIESLNGQEDDVSLVSDALVSSVGWEPNEAEREWVRRTYLAQPEDTRMDSFGVFPSRERTMRLAVMGFTSEPQLTDYLESLDWPGNTAAMTDLITRFRERATFVRTGINIDVTENGLGPDLGLTLIVKQRYTKDSRYWLDGLTDWAPFLDAMAHESLVHAEKLEALADWVTNPSILFGKSGRFVLLRGIHHIKLVLIGDRLAKAKAYVFMVLSSVGNA